MYLKSRQKDKIRVFLFEPDKMNTVKKEKPVLVTHVTKSGVKGLSFELCYHLSFFLFI